MNQILLSKLKHTWLIDIDGTIFKHNGHKNSTDSILVGVQKFWGKIPKNDVIILMSARKKFEQKSTLEFLEHYKLRYDKIIFELPVGERILINDRKPRGLKTALAVNVNRDEGLRNTKIIFDEDL